MPPFGFVPQLVMLFAFLLLPHGSLLCPAKPLHSFRLHFTRYLTLRSSHRFRSVCIHFSRLSVHRLPIILLACGSPRAAANVPHLHPRPIAGAPHQPCVPIVWHRLRLAIADFIYLPHLQHRSPPQLVPHCSQAPTLGSTRRTAR